MVREARPEDADGIVEVQSGAFRFAADADRCRRLRDKLHRSVDGWLVLEHEGRVAATVQARRDALRIGRATVLKAEVGGVSVHPSLQGSGLGTQLMTEAVRRMRDQHIALSRLGGLVRFYERFGYRRFPRRYVDLAVGGVTRAGASRLEEGMIPIAPERAGCVRRFCPESDTSPCLELIERFTRDCAGQPVDREEPLSGSSPLFLVYEEHGRPIALCRALEYEHEPSEFEARITVAEVAYEPDRPYALQTLLLHLHNEACAKGIRRMTARIPFDADAVAALSGLPIRFQLVETYGGRAANMMQVIDLHALVEALIPEWEDRLQAGLARDGCGRVHLAIEKADAHLDIERGRVRLAGRCVSDLALVVREEELIRLVLGLLSYEELAPTEAVPPAGRWVLSTLFPRRRVAASGWG